MAQRQTRSKDISLSVHNFSLTAPPSGSYGLKLSGKSPPMVAKVLGSSVAGMAGLQVGDFILKVSGRDTHSVDAEVALRMLREEIGRAVEVCVARPYPVPVTDKEKMKALIVLQTKLDNGTIFLPSGPTYSTAVQDALAATQDILGDLGLGLDTNPASGQGNVQEVEVKMYDSDSLPSPPPSSESEGEKDPLLDFSRHDDLTYKPAQGSQSLADSVRQATEALESIKSLTASLQKKSPQKSAPKVSTEATFTPSGGPARAARETSRSPPLFDVPEAELQWRGPAVAAEAPVEVSVQQVLQSTPQPHQDDHPPPVPSHGRQRDGRETVHEERERKGKAEEREVATEKGEVVLRRQAPRAPPRDQVKEHVPLRKKQSTDRPAGVGEDGPVVGMPAGYRKFSPPSDPTPQPSSQDPAPDLADQEAACRGLPPSIVLWQGEEVATWLAQLSPTLSHHYQACFSRHDITGQTLMRLNLPKLKSIGIGNIQHCRQLALEIAKLKIYQESLELRELEEENQISFL